jgi:group II intron reverse transcriptase/maturase
VPLLQQAYYWLKREAAPGVDGITWDAYGEGLQARLRDLEDRIHRGSYRAQPSRRVYIPKPDGRQRPLGIAALDDKIVQRAVLEVLNTIYETDFLGFSYGFRPGRGQHDALDALAVGIESQAVKWILDADIRGFFDTISHAWMMRLIEHRIGDRRVLRLIRKWLKVGVVEDGVRQPATRGTPQGAVISPLLANIYLHYAYDLWAEQWRRRHARGAMVVVRYADDTVVGFEHRADAERFLAELRDRLAAFDLELHPDKTRLIEFGRTAVSDRAARGDGKPETFDFLGFTHICARARRGGFQLARHTRRDRKRSKLLEITEDLRRRWHQDTAEQGRWARWCAASLPTTPCPPTCAPSRRSATTSSNSGDAPCAGAASGIARRGGAWTSWPIAGCPDPGYPTPGRLNASASNTQGGSRMRECRMYGSVRGALSNGRPYRD